MKIRRKSDPRCGVDDVLGFPHGWYKPPCSNDTWPHWEIYTIDEWEEVPEVQDVDVMDQATVMPSSTLSIFAGDRCFYLPPGYEWRKEKAYVIPDDWWVFITNIKNHSDSIEDALDSMVQYISKFKTTALRIVEVREGDEKINV